MENNILQQIRDAYIVLKRQAEEKGLPPVTAPPMVAPPEIWEARQAAIDAGDLYRALLIDLLIAQANGYLHR